MKYCNYCKRVEPCNCIPTTTDTGTSFNLQTKIGVNWEDPEFDIFSSIRQIQEVLDKLITK